MTGPVARQDGHRRVVYPPMPELTDNTRFFWEGAARRELLILRCQDCGYYVHPPRPICRRCLSVNMTPERVSGLGTLYTYTVSVAAYHPYWTDKVPFVLAVVELDEQPGLAVTTNIIDCPEKRLRVGLPVEVTFTDAAPGLTLPVFHPRSGAAG
ncbi:OB-fold domain-containing protein [Pseudofrankia sp. DC12]|uniref:Zn-ribbon domain-containing OB-fold protein n=1 Tax=Pseudofrankia sp. DC12 TaxID=683315 RepID=UPI000AF722CD|nr:OB-fold domain-containing protein [Pseudofrankia sp. DC12]